MRNRIFALLAALCLLSGLCACTAAPEGEGAAQEDAGTLETGAAQEAESDETAPEAETADEPGPETEEDSGAETDAAVLVAYFSATGNTAAVAGQIAQLTGGDLYEIVPAEPYTEADLDYRDSESRTSLEMDDPDARPALGGEDLLLEGYTTLYLGYPIWHGEAPRILSTFVESYRLDGLTVIPFCTSASSGVGSSAEDLAALSGEGIWLEGTRFAAGVSEDELQAWLDGLEQ